MLNGTPLTFNEFQKVCHERHISSFLSRNGRCSEWTIVDWSNAICGEAGELANRVKKVRRGDMTLEEARVKILSEIADVLTYAIEFMTFLDANAAKELLRVFNEVSARPEVDFPQIHEE